MKKLGVQYIQGFYFSRPLPKDEFIKFVKEKKIS
jgi:sensor c-di-GMP phosphodiesterase-like protein